MNETKEYPCEACLGLTPFKRFKCPYCGRLYCKYHINNHNCIKTNFKPLSCNGCDYDFNEDCSEGCCKIE